MTDQISIREAKAKFSELCNRAHNGEVIVLMKNGKPWAAVTPIQHKPRSFGKLQGISGKVNLDEFNGPLDEEEALWLGEDI